MSRALQISLMLLTAMLCSICLRQWHQGSLASEKIRTLAAGLQEAGETMQNQTLTLQRWETEITRLNAALAAQTTAVQEQAALHAEAATATQSLSGHQKVLTEHQTLTETLRTQLQQALTERDTLATRLNERTREFNVLAEKYRKKQ